MPIKPDGDINENSVFSGVSGLDLKYTGGLPRSSTTLVVSRELGDSSELFMYYLCATDRKTLFFHSMREKEQLLDDIEKIHHNVEREQLEERVKFVKVGTENMAKDITEALDEFEGENYNIILSNFGGLAKEYGNDDFDELKDIIMKVNEKIRKDDSVAMLYAGSYEQGRTDIGEFVPIMDVVYKVEVGGEEVDGRAHVLKIDRMREKAVPSEVIPFEIEDGGKIDVDTGGSIA